MKDDELQILGKEQRLGKRKKWHKILFAVVAVVLALGGLWLCSQDKSNVRTTLVPELQAATDYLLNEELETIDGLQGQVIVMRVETGEILSMVGRERRFDGKFQPCENFGYQQEPGSVMQTAALLAMLETGKVKLEDEVDTGSGVWNIDSISMKDHNWHRGGYGKITLASALKNSSNIGISKTVRKVFRGNEKSYFELLDNMSFGQPSTVDGIDELNPMICSSMKDSASASRQMLWNAVGYERKMAPLQILTFYNAIANNGRMVMPMLHQAPVTVINEQIASKENIAKMQHLLYEVVTDGTAKMAKTSLTSVAGKTGTATVKDISINEDASIHEYHVLFCGYFPAEAPKYSVIVSLNKQGLPASSASMAGVVFRKIAEWLTQNEECVLQKSK